jgi:hypothetical protein
MLGEEDAGTFAGVNRRKTRDGDSLLELEEERPATVGEPYKMI